MAEACPLVNECKSADKQETLNDFSEEMDQTKRVLKSDFEIRGNSLKQTDETVQASSSSCMPETSYVRTKMLARVALSDAHFKHQQRGEPDLTLEEKIEIAQNILDSNKVTFLSKFWKYLELEDLEYFKDSSNIYEVDFYMKQVMKNKNKTFQKNIVKNRRYEAMKELISEGDYFSEEEMKFREPYLYEQMVGQYLTQKEIQGKVDKADLKFSSILLKHIDQLDENIRFGQSKDKEVCNYAIKILQLIELDRGVVANCLSVCHYIGSQP